MDNYIPNNRFVLSTPRDFIVEERGVVPVVTLEEVRAHLNLFDDQSFDDLLTLSLDAAQQSVEDYIGEYLSETTVVQPYGFFQSIMPLQHERIDSITSITYKAEDGTEKTVNSSTYIYDDTSAKKYIRLKNGQQWPTDLDTVNYLSPVKVTYEAQWTTPPLPISHAILMIVSEMFENRNVSDPRNLREVPVSAKYLLRPYERI